MNADQAFRLERGGRIDRDRPLQFVFDGIPLTGYQGDTLASALLANGVRVVGRSFKFHRPRGVLSAGAEEPNALVRVGHGSLEESSVRATMQPLYEGLHAQSQNCWPGVNFDLGRIVDFAHRLFPAGFYNKTFMWPHWHWFEGSIRRMAGLGRVNSEYDPDHYEHRNAHCDVLVCGAGAAGLAAACAAAGSGARVILAEQDREPGGGLLWRTARLDAEPGDAWAADKWQELARYDKVKVLKCATVTGMFDDNLAVILERVWDRRAAPGPGGPRERLWKVRARQVVFATGAIEQPLVFPWNDRPGIMLADAVQQYLLRYAVAAGRRVVIAANNDSAYSLATELPASGIAIAALVDSRSATAIRDLDKIQAAGIPVFADSCIVATRGAKGVRRIRVMSRTGSAPIDVDCDCVAMSGGWQPAVHLFSQAKGRLRYSEELRAFVPECHPPSMQVVGAANGTFNLEAAVREGYEAGERAARSGRRSPLAGRSDSERCAEQVHTQLNCSRQWIDFQHDVTLLDIDMAVDENFTSVEHMKRYTTAGMGSDQGKTGNINALLALAERTGRSGDQVGTTTFRPFYVPVTLGALAGHRRGELYAPVQRSPLFECHESLGAHFHDYGSWRRPAAYPLRGETLQEAVQREALAARRGVVLFDGSSLGKIEVRGRDAAEFLNRLYVNNLNTLEPGRARYCLMLNENGVVMDDGIVVCLEFNHFLVHTTSSAAGTVFNWMETWLHGDWPHLDVLLTEVTSQWVNIAVSGPGARDLVRQLDCGVDFSKAAFPHMSLREGLLGTVPVRILRASFTGETGFELNVPAEFGASLWDRLLKPAAGQAPVPLGVEALMVLRAEMGFIHVGGDTDGTTTPDDLGWSGVIAAKQTDFVGRRSLLRSANRREGRLQFVGLRPLEDGAEVSAGAHVVNAVDHAAPARSQGFVTSAVWSPVLNRWVALGLVRDGRRRLDEQVNLYDQGKITPALIVAPAAMVADHD